jgi:hypothetical protein
MVSTFKKGVMSMTAREFLLEYAYLEDSDRNLFLLTQYLDISIDYLSFPDADIPECDPVEFMEYVDQRSDE